MGKDSAISWTDHTFNPWWGCTRVSPACENCYAESNAKRFGHPDLWGSGGRRFFTAKHWYAPHGWDRAAEKTGERARVFCGSMCDVFERHPEPEWDRKLNQMRGCLWDLIDDSPWLTWMLLTKRIHNVGDMVPWPDSWPDNVWLGVTAENQAMADERIPIMLQYPAKVRFVSVEPMLSRVGLTDQEWWDWRYTYDFYPPGFVRRPIDWVIVGGESGAHARPTHPDWVRDLRDQCREADVPFHFKQWGEWGPGLSTALENGVFFYTDGHIEDEWDGRYSRQHRGLNMQFMVRYGRKKSGHLLDGEEWLEFPATG